MARRNIRGVSNKRILHLIVKWNAGDSFEPDTIAQHAEVLQRQSPAAAHVWWGKISKTGKLGLKKQYFDQISRQLIQGQETYLYLYCPDKPRPSLHVGKVDHLQEVRPIDVDNIPFYYTRVIYPIPFWFRLKDIREISVEHFRNLLTIDGNPFDPVASNLYPLPITERQPSELFNYGQTGGRRWFELQHLNIPGASSPSLDPNFVFVLMPFAKEFDDTWQLGIRPAVESLGLTCKRADDFLHNRDIMEVIRESIRRARLLVAEMTTSNANVFYELGFAHALGKPVILITRDRKQVPFDLQSINSIEYSSIREVRDQLGNLVKSVLENY